jgi:hypothetical protein
MTLLRISIRLCKRSVKPGAVTYQNNQGPKGLFFHGGKTIHGKKIYQQGKKMIFFFTAVDDDAKLIGMDGIPSGNCTDANILNRSPGMDNITS